MRLVFIIGLVITATLGAFSQTWQAQGLTTPLTYNDVVIVDLTHPASLSWMASYGVASVTSITTNGVQATVNTTEAMGDNVHVGDTCNIYTRGLLHDAISSDLLGNCTIASISPGGVTINSTSSGRYTLNPPADNSGPAVAKGPDGKLWMLYREAQGSNESPIPGVLKFIKSTTDASVVPPEWGTPSTIYRPPPNVCASATKQCDLRDPILATMPNGDMAAWFFEVDFAPPYRYTAWNMYYDQKRSAWVGPSQFTALPVGEKIGHWQWCLMQDSGTTFTYGGVPAILVAGIRGTLYQFCLAQGGATHMSLYIVLSRDNGHTWGATPSTDIIGPIQVAEPTNEVAACNVGGTNYIAFERDAEGSGPLLLGTSTNGTTWTWRKSGIPTPISSLGTPSLAYGVSPFLSCGHPTSSLVTLTWYDRWPSYGMMRQLVIDPAQVLSGGSTYLASRHPAQLWTQVPNVTLSGYPYLYFHTPTKFTMFWHSSLNFHQGVLNIFQMSGTLVPGPPSHNPNTAPE